MQGTFTGKEWWIWRCRARANMLFPGTAETRWARGSPRGSTSTDSKPVRSGRPEAWPCSIKRSSGVEPRRYTDHSLPLLWQRMQQMGVFEQPGWFPKQEGPVRLPMGLSRPGSTRRGCLNRFRCAGSSKSPAGVHQASSEARPRERRHPHDEPHGRRL